MRRSPLRHPELRGMVPGARPTAGGPGEPRRARPEHGDWRVETNISPADAEHMSAPGLLSRAQLRTSYLDEGSLPLTAESARELINPVRGMARAWRLLLSLVVLLPLSVVAVFALMIQIYHARPVVELASFWLSVPVWHTLLGGFVLLVCLLRRELRAVLPFLCVVGHELTHAVAALLCLGKVRRFRVGLDGGFIETNKANFFIALSPYFVPIWMLLWLLIFWLINEFHPSDEVQICLYTGFGFWCCFHIYWTLWVIPREQPDMIENGVLFSSLLIFLLNMGMLIAVLAFFGIITAEGYCSDFLYAARRMMHTFADVGELLRRSL